MQDQIAVIIPAPSPTLKGYYKNLRQIKQDVLAHYAEAGDCRVASGQIKMQEFYSPASVFCILGLKEDLGLCIFLIVICG